MYKTNFSYFVLFFLIWKYILNHKQIIPSECVGKLIRFVTMYKLKSLITNKCFTQKVSHFHLNILSVVPKLAIYLQTRLTLLTQLTTTEIYPQT